jgi:uncharacterized BrkB/YihY/UPF0761 family membrane protein
MGMNVSGFLIDLGLIFVGVVLLVFSKRIDLYFEQRAITEMEKKFVKINRFRFNVIFLGLCFIIAGIYNLLKNDIMK